MEDLEKMHPASLLPATIHTVLHGTPEEKRGLHGKFFLLANTPLWMRGDLIGLKGEFFNVKYGVISHHKGKDLYHNLSEQNWTDLGEAVTYPFAITKYRDNDNLFTGVSENKKWIMVGVNVRSIGKGVVVNSVRTAFFTDKPKGEIIYTSNEITPDQKALLDGTDARSLHSDQVSGVVSSISEKKSRAFDERNCGQ